MHTDASCFFLIKNWLCCLGGRDDIPLSPVKQSNTCQFYAEEGKQISPLRCVTLFCYVYIKINQPLITNHCISACCICNCVAANPHWPLSTPESVIGDPAWWIMLSFTSCKSACARCDEMRNAFWLLTNMTSLKLIGFQISQISI